MGVDVFEAKTVLEEAISNETRVPAVGVKVLNKACFNVLSIYCARCLSFVS